MGEDLFIHNSMHAFIFCLFARHIQTGHTEILHNLTKKQSRKVHIKANLICNKKYV